MNGLKNELKRIVIDTNIIYMAWYTPIGKCAQILRYARQGRIILFSTDTAKKEIARALSKQNLDEKEISEFIDELPISWVKKEFYEPALNKTKVKHKPDKPIEALSIMLNCGILSADTDFKDKININELLNQLEEL